MKKATFILLIIAVQSIISSIYAQTEKGKVYLGGNSTISTASLNSKNQSDSFYDLNVKTTSFDFTQQIGFFVANNFTIGLGLSYKSNGTEVESKKYKSTNFSFSPFAQVYFGVEKVKPYIYSGFGWGVSYNDTQNAYDPKQKMFLGELGCGIASFLNKNVSLDFGFGYSFGKMKTDGQENKEPNNIKGFGVNMGIGIYL